jgi:hypothetical protein
VSTYLEDAGKLLREARSDLSRLPRQAAPQEQAEAARLRMRLAAQFAQLAAIERGLQPLALPGSRCDGEDPR